MDTAARNQGQKLNTLFESAYQSYATSLRDYAFFKVHDRALSKDLVQNTFIKTWRYIVKGGRIEVMRAFLYHVLNNLIVDEYRRHKTTSIDALLEKGFEPSVDNSARLFDILDGKTVSAFIKRLPQKYQTVVRMRYFQDLSITEISKAIGKSKNAVSVQAFRGLNKLKEISKLLTDVVFEEARGQRHGDGNDTKAPNN